MICECLIIDICAFLQKSPTTLFSSCFSWDVMWWGQTHRGLGASVLHVRSNKPPFLVANLHRFAAASIPVVNASRLFGSIMGFSKQHWFIKLLGRVIKGDPTRLLSALYQHYCLTTMVQRSLQRTVWEQNANWPPALRSADPSKTMVFYIFSSNSLTMWSRFKALTIWIQIVNCRSILNTIDLNWIQLLNWLEFIWIVCELYGFIMFYHVLSLV